MIDLKQEVISNVGGDKGGNNMSIIDRITTLAGKGGFSVSLHYNDDGHWYVSICSAAPVENYVGKDRFDIEIAMQEAEKFYEGLKKVTLGGIRC